MLRRFEIYPVDPAASPEAKEAMRVKLRDCGKFIPELLHSAIGDASSDRRPYFVWEHAYESPASYRRYMAHPYHAAVLDRFLLSDSPERIILDDDTGLGLVGYDCEGGEYLLPDGAARRLVALNLEEGGEDQFARIAEAEAARAGMLVSVFKPNTFGNRWFDGETHMGFESPISHLWEQGFAKLDAARAYAPQWREKAGDMVENAIELLYEVEAGWGYPESTTPSSPRP
jgi:hypothetical protein